MTLGHFDVYELTFEQITNKLQSDQSNGTKFSSALDNKLFEFKWEKDATLIHGPFSGQEMQAWKDQGYFNQSQRPWIREIGNEFVPFSADISFI
jgi:hypothetical protein